MWIVKCVLRSAGVIDRRCDKTATKPMPLKRDGLSPAASPAGSVIDLPLCLA